MLLGSGSCPKGAQVAAFAGPGVFLSRVKAVATVLELPNHREGRSARFRIRGISPTSARVFGFGWYIGDLKRLVPHTRVQRRNGLPNVIPFRRPQTRER